MQKVMNDGTLGVTPEDRFIAPPGVHFDTDCDGSDNDTVTETEDDMNSFFNM